MRGNGRKRGVSVRVGGKRIEGARENKIGALGSPDHNTGLSPCARACTTCYHSSLAHASCGPRSTAPTISTCTPCGPGVGMPVILWVLFYCMSFVLCHSLGFIFSCFPTNFNSCAPNGSGKVLRYDKQTGYITHGPLITKPVPY